jgi:hypothetical protein
MRFKKVPTFLAGPLRNQKRKKKKRKKYGHTYIPHIGEEGGGGNREVKITKEKKPPKVHPLVLRSAAIGSALPSYKH